jgi:hypothetical protein
VGLTKALLLTLTLVPIAGNAATLQTSRWPEERDCVNCIRVQTRRLELQLPQTEVSKIFTTGTGGLAVDLVPPSGDLRESISIFDRTQGHLRDLFSKSGFLADHGIKTPRDYWDALGAEPAPGDKNLGSVRQVELIDTASSYTRLTKGPLTTYVIGGG